MSEVRDLYNGATAFTVPRHVRVTLHHEIVQTIIDHNLPIKLEARVRDAAMYPSVRAKRRARRNAGPALYDSLPAIQVASRQALSEIYELLPGWAAPEVVGIVINCLRGGRVASYVRRNSFIHHYTGQQLLEAFASITAVLRVLRMDKRYALGIDGMTHQELLYGEPNPASGAHTYKSRVIHNARLYLIKK